MLGLLAGVIPLEKVAWERPHAHLGRHRAIQAHGSSTGLSRRQEFFNTGFIRLGYLLGRRWKQ